MKADASVEREYFVIKVKVYKEGRNNVFTRSHHRSAFIQAYHSCFHLPRSALNYYSHFGKNILDTAFTRRFGIRMFCNIPPSLITEVFSCAFGISLETYHSGAFFFLFIQPVFHERFYKQTLHILL